MNLKLLQYFAEGIYYFSKATGEKGYMTGISNILIGNSYTSVVAAHLLLSQSVELSERPVFVINLCHIHHIHTQFPSTLTLLHLAATTKYRPCSVVIHKKLALWTMSSNVFSLNSLSPLISRDLLDNRHSGLSYPEKRKGKSHKNCRQQRKDLIQFIRKIGRPLKLKGSRFMCLNLVIPWSPRTNF